MKRAAQAFGPGALFALFVVAACSRAPDPEASIRATFVQQLALAADAGAVWHLTSNDEVIFDDGFYPMETGKDGVHGDAWRWMGKNSLLRLRNHPAPMKLQLTGWVPFHLLAAPPLMTLRWKGKRVDAFLAPAGRFSKTVLVTAEMQSGAGLSDFTIETSSVGSEPGDPRELGFALAEVRWEPAKD